MKNERNREINVTFSFFFCNPKLQETKEREDRGRAIKEIEISKEIFAVLSSIVRLNLAGSGSFNVRMWRVKSLYLADIGGIERDYIFLKSHKTKVHLHKTV